MCGQLTWIQDLTHYRTQSYDPLELLRELTRADLKLLIVYEFLPSRTASADSGSEPFDSGQR